MDGAANGCHDVSGTSKMGIKRSILALVAVASFGFALASAFAHDGVGNDQGVAPAPGVAAATSPTDTIDDAPLAPGYEDDLGLPDGPPTDASGQAVGPDDRADQPADTTDEFDDQQW